jgi:predicted anti-sigma-YlaC factor YlaD
LLIVLAVVILFAILWPVFAAGTTVAEAVYRTILALLCLLVLRFVVTRV